MRNVIWDTFLQSVDFQKNQDILLRYYYAEFLMHPEEFIKYIHHIAQQIKIKKDTHLAQAYLQVFSPLCERLGMFGIKQEMDDVCFFILYPQESDDLVRTLSLFDKKHKKSLSFIKKKLTQLLAEASIKAEVQGRKKALYSLFHKMRRKGISHVDDVNDIIAFRIVIHEDSEKECFRILNMIHDTFYPIVMRFKDYITIPKINGYQSIHTGVFVEQPGVPKIPVEIQICTQNMYEKGQKGIAAHFLYKKNESKTQMTRNDKVLLEIMQENIQNSAEYIFIITYTGGVLMLPSGSKILDFAYKIHSDVGNFCKKATINGLPVDISSELKSGDIVRIFTSKKKQVSKSWTEYTKQSFTLKKIYEALR